MKYLLAVLLALSLASCKTTGDVDTEDLEKAARFATCSAGCYKSVYGDPVE